MVVNGLLFGLISTLHCAGMCGPLAMYVPGQVKQNKLLFGTLYQVGRIGVYLTIGALVFAIGISFSMFRLQQTLSIVMGSLMVLYVLWPMLKLPVPAFMKVSGNGFLKKISGLLNSGKSSSAFALGVMNGLLPCGAIYIAALYCATFSNIGQALAYMTLFGLGTMPVFIAGWMFLSKQLSFKVRRFSFLYKLLPLIVGVLMVLRGADLGIPYLSPELSAKANQTEVKNCCKH